MKKQSLLFFPTQLVTLIVPLYACRTHAEIHSYKQATSSTAFVRKGCNNTALMGPLFGRLASQLSCFVVVSRRRLSQFNAVKQLAKHTAFGPCSRSCWAGTEKTWNLWHSLLEVRNDLGQSEEKFSKQGSFKMKMLCCLLLNSERWHADKFWCQSSWERGSFRETPEASNPAENNM